MVSRNYSVQENDLSDESVFPCTVIPVRFEVDGVHKPWLAFAMEYLDIPDALYESQELCQQWLNAHQSRMTIGQGSTPTDAVQDLIRQMKIFDLGRVL